MGENTLMISTDYLGGRSARKSPAPSSARCATASKKLWT